MRNSNLVLLLCSGLLLSGGAILGGSAGWSILRMSYYFWTTDLGAELGAGVQLVAGAILCLPACWLAALVPYHPRMLSVLGTLMFLTTTSIVVLSTGLTSLGALSRAAREPAQLNASMLRALARAQYDHAVRSAFSSMQIERDECEESVFTMGCLQPALYELRYYVNSMSVLASVIIITLAVTLFATSYILVGGVIERGELRAVKTAPALRVACLHPSTAPLVSLVPPYSAVNPNPPAGQQM